jgi:transposase InsO family protein
MQNDDGQSARWRWARFRFSVVGELLASPPESGELRQKLDQLAAKSFRHPTTGEAVRFGRSTIERWLYAARNGAANPLEALARKVPGHAGHRPSVTERVLAALRSQYRDHPRWTYQLHYDNLVALAKSRPELAPLPSYGTVTRVMKEQGMVKRRRKRRGHQDDRPFLQREVRSFEVSHVQALWHSDFHEGSRRVALPDGQYVTPKLLGVLDDRSRLCCHLQWYLDETTESFVHGLSQAILKRGLPRAILTDNGSAMIAGETTQGLERLGIIHHTTLPYTPEQNAKQESFWAQVEGRLMAMLEGKKTLSLAELNRATCAWVEQEYHYKLHSELGSTPLEVFLAGPSVGRLPADADSLRHVFRLQERRTQRRSDGTLTVCGVRFELPWQYQTLLRPVVRFARWDLSSIDLVDEYTDKILCPLYPLDKRNNADRRRRATDIVSAKDAQPEDESGIAPHLAMLMAEYSASGLPPAYLPSPTTGTLPPDEPEPVDTNLFSHLQESNDE